MRPCLKAGGGGAKYILESLNPLYTSEGKVYKIASLQEKGEARARHILNMFLFPFPVSHGNGGGEGQEKKKKKPLSQLFL